MGKASNEQARVNRQAVVEAASRLMRERGVDGTGVREVMTAAGLTSGAFAKQFSSKEALAAEACAHAFEGAERAFEAMLRGDSHDQAHRLAKAYLAPKDADQACPMASLAGDAARAPADSPIRTAYGVGLRRIADLVAGDPLASDHLVLLAALVGGAVLIGAGQDMNFSERLRGAIIDYGSTLDRARVWDGEASGS